MDHGGGERMVEILLLPLDLRESLVTSMELAYVLGTELL